MSAILVVVLYAIGLGLLCLGAHDFAAQYNQPWLYQAALGGACWVTARYVARGIS